MNVARTTLNMKNTMTLSISTCLRVARRVTQRVLLLGTLAFAPLSLAFADITVPNEAVVRPLDLESNVLPSAVRVRLAAIADDQAQIWGDTILEGDYYAEEEVSLDKVEAILLDSVLIAYRITYSSVAFETSACEISVNRDPATCGCLPGRISESTFVAPNLDSWTRDADAYAEFIADEA